MVEQTIFKKNSRITKLYFWSFRFCTTNINIAQLLLNIFSICNSPWEVIPFGGSSNNVRVGGIHSQLWRAYTTCMRRSGPRHKNVKYIQPIRAFFFIFFFEKKFSWIILETLAILIFDDFESLPQISLTWYTLQPMFEI